jgi:hypothetical protein
MPLSGRPLRTPWTPLNSPFGRSSGRALWTVPLHGPSGRRPLSTRPLWTVPLDGPFEGSLWATPLDGLSGRSLLDSRSGRSLFTALPCGGRPRPSDGRWIRADAVFWTIPFRRFLDVRSLETDLRDGHSSVPSKRFSRRPLHAVLFRRFLETAIFDDPSRRPICETLRDGPSGPSRRPRLKRPLKTASPDGPSIRSLSRR